MKCSACSIAFALVIAGCATLGSTGEGDVDLPSSGVGPFRKLATVETKDVAPFVFHDNVRRYRQPSAVAQDDDPASTRVLLFAVAAETSAGRVHDVIVRTRADDGRSFFATASDLSLHAQHVPLVVLRADLAWEGEGVTSPSVMRVGTEIWLYYAGAGGVGLARSSDGITFRKEAAPVLASDASVTWETSAPSAPSVARYPDGRWRMMYAAGGQIGEASSDDGVLWTRLDADPTTRAIDPVLGVSAPIDPASLAPGEKPPFDTGEVGDPCLLPRITASGRLHVRVLYTGWDGPRGAASRMSAIGFAARYGDSGRLVRNVAPVYAVGQHEAAPSLFSWSRGALLYVEQTMPASGSGSGASPAYPGIAAAFAPPAQTLPPAADFPDSD
jgi:hypothetical protein